MKKLLSSVLILTLSLNSFGANCSATDETSGEASKTTVSEKIKQINDNLAQIKNKTLTETEENATEKTKTEQKDDSKSCENKASDSTAEAQKDATKPVNKSFREKQIEKLNKEIQNLEKTSNKKYFWKKFFINTLKILGVLVGWVLALYEFLNLGAFLEIGKSAGFSKGYEEGYDDGQQANSGSKPATGSELKEKIKPVVKSILKTLHPDNLKRIKSFDDIKDAYYNINNFYDEYLK